MLSKDVKVSVGLAYATGTADRDGATLDMKGWDGVLMIAQFGTIAAGGANSIKAQQGAASSLSDAADLEGTKQTIADDYDGKIALIDIYQPRERYVRVVVDKDTTNACAETVTYIQYRGKHLPATHGSGVASEVFVSPGEGTA